VEDATVIISVHAPLDEVSASQGTFSRPQFNHQFTFCSSKEYATKRRGFLHL
jgi:hypothetical protein